MRIKGKADFIIQDVAGCGLFQVVLTLLVDILANTPCIMSVSFMAFGIHNPGWRCIDLNATHANMSTNIYDNRQNISSSSNSSNLVYNNCPLFESCRSVQFDTQSSTIIGEWGLLCDKGWISRFMLTLQMIGILVGALLAGQLGDTFGRKTTIYGSLSALAILNTASIFSYSWKMFAVLRFFIGMVCATLMSFTYVLLSEFSTIKYRAALAAIPIWPIIGITNSVLIMTLKDWRQILIVTAAMSILGFLPVFWVPESLRWLEVKHKTDRFMNVAKKVTKMNGKKLPTPDVMMSVTTEQPESNKTIFTILSLFRPGYKTYTIVLGLMWFTVNVWSATIAYGVTSISGNFYVNLIIVPACTMPSKLYAIFAPNILGRRISYICILFLSTACFILAICFRLSPLFSFQTLGVRILTFIAKSTTGAFWSIIYVYNSEIYPTVVRSIGQSWGSLMARIGGIVASFLIPKDPDMIVTCYAVLGSFGLICCIGVFRLPETQGKPLKETFEQVYVDGGPNDVEREQHTNIVI